MVPKVLLKDSPEYRNLEKVAGVLNAISIDPSVNFYRVENVFFDAGKGWMWTTVIRYGGEYGGVQVLTPREWAFAIMAETQTDILNLVKSVVNGKWFSENEVKGGEHDDI